MLYKRLSDFLWTVDIPHIKYSFASFLMDAKCSMRLP